MLEIKKIDPSKIQIDLEENIYDFYALLDNEKRIGYGFITDKKDDRIKIYIFDEYRKKGFGTKLFKLILDIINDDVIVKTNNIYMIKIIDKYNGKELSTLDGYISFLIPNKMGRNNT